MAAAQAALETHELLENIISRLPARSITKVMRVSKAWKTIATSPRLHNSRILLPTGKQTRCHGISQSIEWTSFPVYHAESRLRLHPAFELRNSGSAIKLVYRSASTRAHSALRNAQSDFATYPPCQAICLNMYTVSRAMKSECVVYHKYGVTIKNVLEVIDAMMISFPRPDSDWNIIIVDGGFLRW